MKTFIWLILLLVAISVLLGFRLTSVPPGINGDESGIGYNAHLISRNLTDENSNFLPLFVFAKESDWKQPVTVYTTAALFKLFGPSFFALRATSIFFVLTSLVLLFLISKYHKGSFFVYSSLLLVTTPIVMIQSHLALENSAVLPFIFAWIASLLAFDRTTKKQYLLVAGIALGIGLFSYLGMRLAVPVLALLTVIYLKKPKEIFHFLAGIIPFILLLAFAYFRYPSAVLGNFKSDDVFSLYDFFYRWLSVFDISFLFFKGDATPIHSTGFFGMLLLPSLPLFVYGAYKTIIGNDRFNKLLLISFFLAPFFFGLIPDIHRASRLLVLVPMYVIISTIGLLALSRKVQLVFIVLVLITFALFVNDYWFFYPNRVKEVFPVTIDQTHEFRLKK